MKFFKLTGALLAASLALPGAAFAEVNLKLSSFLPPPHQMNVELNRWADELREKSGGELNIEIFPASQMGPPPRQLDLARTGVADMSFVFTAFNPGRFPRTDILTSPFLLSDENGASISAADASWLATSMRADFAADSEGVKVLYYVTTGALGLFMNEKIVTSPDDLKGLRMRPTSASVADMLVALGASPASLPPTEVADAIGKGVVDGAVFNFEGGKVFGLAQSVKEVSYFGFSAGTFAVVMNEGVYNGLPDALKALIDETTTPEDARRVGGLYDAAEAAGEDFMKGEGVNVHRLSVDQLAPFRTILAPLGEAQLEALKADGIDGQALVNRVNDLKSQL